MSEFSDPEVPPWQEPGALRRDYLPHRGGLLHMLGTLALLAGVFSLCCVPLGFVALPLGIVVCNWAWRDLKDMQTGTVDPRGKPITAEALYFGGAGTLAGTIGLVIWAYILSVAL